MGHLRNSVLGDTICNLLEFQGIDLSISIYIFGHTYINVYIYIYIGHSVHRYIYIYGHTYIYIYRSFGDARESRGGCRVSDCNIARPSLGRSG